jgi:transposase
VILAEIGGDMSGFPRQRMTAWVGVTLPIYESAGTRSPTGARHGKRWLTIMQVEAAAAIARTKGANCHFAQHARLTARRGMALVQEPSRTESRS